MRLFKVVAQIIRCLVLILPNSSWPAYFQERFKKGSEKRQGMVLIYFPFANISRSDWPSLVWSLVQSNLVTSLLSMYPWQTAAGLLELTLFISGKNILSKKSWALLCRWEMHWRYPNIQTFDTFFRFYCYLSYLGVFVCSVRSCSCEQSPARWEHTMGHKTAEWFQACSRHIQSLTIRRASLVFQVFRAGLHHSLTIAPSVCITCFSGF